MIELAHEPLGIRLSPFKLRGRFRDIHWQVYLGPRGLRLKLPTCEWSSMCKSQIQELWRFHGDSRACSASGSQYCITVMLIEYLHMAEP